MVQNKNLYTDNNPKTTIKGFGFANKEKAFQSIDILNNLNNIKQWKSEKEKETYIKQVLVTLYYRAKHHPKRTRQMEESMDIFRKYAIDNNLDISLK